MSERRDGQRHYDTSNPCSELITGVAAEDARLREINANLLKACKAQHEAIDSLMAGMIESRPGFMPSKCGQPWAALIQGKAAIAKAEETHTQAEEDEDE